MKIGSLVLCFFLLTGLYFLGASKIVSSGKYFGKPVEAAWEGWFIKSCEGKFQMGENSSTLGYCSSLDKNLCDKLKENLGKEVEITYEGTIFAGLYKNTGCILKEIK